MSDKMQLHAFYIHHRVELAEIILDWRSGKNDSPRGLQHPKHG